MLQNVRLNKCSNNLYNQFYLFNIRTNLLYQKSYKIFNMGKRSCPFEESFAPQLKRHVSEVEVNTKCIEKIHSKTLAILFHGSKKLGCSKNKTTGTCKCINCHSQGSLTAKCWFCESALCSACIQCCEICDETFCGNCAVKMYNPEGGIRCLSCVDK